MNKERMEKISEEIRQVSNTIFNLKVTTNYYEEILENLRIEKEEENGQMWYDTKMDV